MGLHRAGFTVIGVDIEPQPRYPFTFIHADALTADPAGFDLVWASPPCQAYSRFNRGLGNAHVHPDLLAPTRALLRSSGIPYIIENVPGAPLRSPFLLCGTMFGMDLLRHRLFETSFPLGDLVPPCQHTGAEIPVYGNGTPQYHRQKLGRNIRQSEKDAAMGIDWMNRDELALAVPPVYAEYMARRFLAHHRDAA